VGSLYLTRLLLQV